MTTAEAMALAVLKGDLVAAKALADHLIADEAGTAGFALPPIQKFTGDFSKLRIVTYVDPALGADVQIDRERMRRSITNWLLRGEPLVLMGFSRLELYELDPALLPSGPTETVIGPDWPMGVTPVPDDHPEARDPLRSPVVTNGPPPGGYRREQTWEELDDMLWRAGLEPEDMGYRPPYPDEDG